MAYLRGRTVKNSLLKNLSGGRMTRSRASASENRAHGAEKIGPRRYSDFFNRIGHKQK